MAAPSGQVPILECVRAALRFGAANWRALALPVVSGALGLVLASAIGSALATRPGGVLLALLLQLLVTGVAYTAFLGVALKGETWRRSYAADIGRLLSAMAIIIFFLFLLFLVALIPGAIALGATLTPYEQDIAAAQNDPEAMNALAARIFTENPAPTLMLFAIYTAAWLAVSSRLYLVAPATVAEERVRSFETWPWTKGAMLRIAAARMLLLWPPLIVLFLVQGAATQAVQGGAAALALPALSIIALATMCIYALEAGLSAYLYRGLKPS